MNIFYDIHYQNRLEVGKDWQKVGLWVKYEYPIFYKVFLDIHKSHINIDWRRIKVHIL